MVSDCRSFIIFKLVGLRLRIPPPLTTPLPAPPPHHRPHWADEFEPQELLSRCANNGSLPRLGTDGHELSPPSPCIKSGGGKPPAWLPFHVELGAPHCTHVNVIAHKSTFVPVSFSMSIFVREVLLPLQRTTSQLSETVQNFVVAPLGTAVGYKT